MWLLKTKASSKLRSLLSHARREYEGGRQLPPGYLDADELRSWKAHYEEALEDAESHGSEMTRHGSCKLVRRQVEIYDEWIEKSLNLGLVSAGEFEHAFENDDEVARLWSEERCLENEQYKERCRKSCEEYGFTRELYSMEAYDLPWLLELKERDWLPHSIDLYNLITRRNDRLEANEHISFLSRVFESESDDHREEWKEFCRKYGRNHLSLLQFEKFDLPWLLEVRIKDLDLPYSIELTESDGSIVVVSPTTWINRLLHDAGLTW